MSVARFARLWGPLLAYQALIFVLSSRPQIPLGVSVWDKALHFGAYAVLAFLWVRVLPGGSGSVGMGKAIAATGLAVLFGVSDEIHQSFVPGRDASAADVLADGLGAAFAAGLLFLRSSRRDGASQENAAADGV